MQHSQYAHHNMARAGWFSGDGHQHIQPGPGALERTAAWCGEQALHWLFVCQPWFAKRDWYGTDAKAGMPAPAAHAGFNAWLGAEAPKTRYGHTWWVNLRALHRPFRHYTDRTMERHYVSPVTGNPAEIPYESVPMHVAWAEHLADGAVPVHPHPTSWWTAHEGRTFVTNISALLPLYVLSGMGPAVMVVMGYDADHVFYQDLWFNLLNRGYRVTAAAETDGAVDSARPRFRIGAFRTYAYLGPDARVTADAVACAIRQGRTIVSSGPFIDARIVDGAGSHRPGSVLQADGRARRLELSIHAAPLPGEAVSHVLVYRNGSLFRHRNLTDARHARWTESIDLAERDEAWYIVKCYGAAGPSSDAAFDVRRFAQACIASGETPYAGDGQVAMTSPFYFRGDTSRPDPPPLLPTAAAWERAMGDGVVRGLTERLWTGAWRAEHPAAAPGQVPWEAFAFDALAARLKELKTRRA
ncbi:CehA/McbA family metallohydrolase [bacterium]|nr:CehA/McbA family metallohydrolase [bacterium]